MRFLIWKWRKYPIKRDEDGRSLREQSFDLFEKKYRPSQIYKQRLLPVKLKTLFRYFEDWKKVGDHLSYRMIRTVIKQNPDVNQQIIEALAKHLRLPVEAVQKRMLEPWGLLQLLRGEPASDRFKKEQHVNEARMRAALNIMRLMGKFYNTPEEIAELFLQINLLGEGTTLELSKKDGQLTIKKIENNKVTTLKLDYWDETNG